MIEKFICPKCKKTGPDYDDYGLWENVDQDEKNEIICEDCGNSYFVTRSIIWHYTTSNENGD